MYRKPQGVTLLVDSYKGLPIKLFYRRGVYLVNYLDNGSEMLKQQTSTSKRTVCSQMILLEYETQII